MTPTETHVTSKKTGKQIPVQVTVKVPAIWPCEHGTALADLTAFGVPVFLREKESLPCLFLSRGYVAQSSVGAFFGQKLSPKSDLYIALEETSHEALKALCAELLAPALAERTTYREQLETERAAAPKRYFHESGTYWGDYSTEFISMLVVYRALTPTERQERPLSTEGQLIKHEILVSAVPDLLLKKQGLDLLARPVAQEEALASSYTLREVSESEVAIIVAAAALAATRQKEKEAAEAAAKEEAARKQQQAQAEHRAQVEAEELFIFSAGTIYSSNSNEMLHSLGARFHEEAGHISIYTTAYARDIANAATTYSLRGELAEAGYTFDQPTKEWRLPYSEENGHKTVAFLRQNDSRAWPAELGMGRCWECGCYSRHLDSDGYCGC